MANQSYGERATKEIGRLKEDVGSLAQQLASFVDSTTDEALDEIRGQMHRVKRRLDEALSEAGERGQEAAVAVRDVAGTVTEAVEDSLHRHPLTTIGIALGLGFVCGAAWRR